MAMTENCQRDLVVSIRPIYASKIVKGTKTVDLRRRFPSQSANGAIAFIYSSKPVQAIVGYARIKKVHQLPIREIWRKFGDAACIERKDFDQYFLGLKYGYAIVLDEAQELSEYIKVADLQTQFGFLPPQSFRYLYEKHAPLLRDERLQISDRY